MKDKMFSILKRISYDGCMEIKKSGRGYYCKYCGASVLNIGEEIYHKHNCIYDDTEKLLKEIDKMGGLGDNLEESRKKVAEWVRANNPEDFKDNLEDDMECAAAKKPIRWINGLPDGKAEMFTPEDMEREKRRFNIENERITGKCIKDYLPEVEEKDIPKAYSCKKPKTNPLNKVRDEKMKVDDILISFAELFRTKNAEHGSAYKKIGIILENLFPNGLTLKNSNDFNKFTTLVQMFYKLTRLCNTCFDKDKLLLHDSRWDSPQDLSVYAAIFCELLAEEENDISTRT